MKVKELKQILESKGDDLELWWFVDGQSNKDFKLDEINTQPSGSKTLCFIIKET